MLAIPQPQVLHGSIIFPSQLIGTGTGLGHRHGLGGQV